MRWLAKSLAGTTYIALVALVWVNGGARVGLILLAAAVFLTASFRPNEVGDVIRGWAHWFHRPRAHVPSRS
jgi:hypothetical protein